MCRHGKFGTIIRWRIEFGNNRGIAEGDRAAGGEVDFAPQAHVFVGRRGIPVDEGDGEILLGGGEDLYRENIFAVGFQNAGDAQFVGAPGSGDVVGVGDLFSVEPNVGAVVDAFEIQPDGFAGIGSGRGKLIAIPPGDRVGAVGLHRSVRKICADGVRHAGELAEVCGEEWIGEGFVRYHRRDDRGGNGGVVPSLGNEGCGRNDLALGLDFGGGFERPVVAENKLFRRRALVR